MILLDGKNSLAIVLIMMLIATYFQPSTVYGESKDESIHSVSGADINQLDELVKEPASHDFDGYTVKIGNGISSKMAHSIDDTDGAEQLSDQFVQVETPEDILDFSDTEQIEYIEPNYYVYPDEVKGNPSDVISGHPDDPSYGTSYIDDNTSEEIFNFEQWNLEMVNAEAAWKEGLRGRGVKVGIIDTGFDNSYKDIYAEKQILGKNFTGSKITGDISTSSSHGTKVTSVLYSAINNGTGIAGITDRISIIPLKVGSATTLSTGADVVKAIEYARKNDIDVINMCMGMDHPYKPMEDQINYYSLEGGIFVASGGNQGRVAPRYPAGCYNSVAVGGVTKTGEIWENSNHNKSIEVVAPAKSVLNGLGITGSGTSYAAPHVTALAAMAKQFSNNKINVTEFKNLLHTSSSDEGDPGRDDYYGYGIVNYERFIDQLSPENSNGSAAVRPYPVFYKTNGGTISGNYSNFYYGSSVFKLPAIKRKGYIFKGWYQNSKFSGPIHTFIPAGSTGQKTFYAKWKPNTYTIKFNVNKGKKIKTQKKLVTYDKAIGKMPVPKRAGYKFAGWYTKKKKGSQYSRYKTYKNIKSITLYARWTKNNTLTFYPNNGKVSIYKKIVIKGKKISTLPKPTRKGYNFLGWFTKKKGGKQYTSSMVYDRKSNRKLYAHWTKKAIVKFHANGGIVKKYAKSINTGKKLGKLPAPRRTGYKFKGWYSKKSGGSKRTQKFKVNTVGNFVLYAHWKKK